MKRATAVSFCDFQMLSDYIKKVGLNPKFTAGQQSLRNLLILTFIPLSLLRSFWLGHIIHLFLGEGGRRVV